MMTDFVKTLLESTASDDGVIVDDNVQVEECSIPISTIIESAVADFDIAMTNAIEVYEMACVIGGVKVVSEGAGQSEAATLLEAASENFFTKIAGFFKKIGQKIAEIWNMVLSKVKTIGKNSQKTYNKYRAAAKEKLKKAEQDGKKIPLPETVEIINVDTGEKNVGEAISGTISTWSDIDGVISEEFSGDWSDEKNSEMINTDWSISAAFGRLCGKKLPADASAETIKEFVAEKYKVKTKEPSLNATHINIFTKVVDLAASEEVAGAGKLCKMIEKSAKKLENAADAFSKKAPDGDTAKAFFTAAQKMISTMTNISLTVINTRASIIINAATAYANYIKGVATGKIAPAGETASNDEGSGEEQQATTDSVDYSVFFEGYDIVEEGCSGEDCDDEDDDVLEGGCKKKSSMESQSIVDIASMLV